MSAEVSEPPEVAQAGRILVVDDEQDVTNLVAYHLRAKGFEVDVLNDPMRVMGQVRARPPDLIILDVMMPDLNGVQLCRLIRADPKLGTIPLIFLSARTEEADRIRGLEGGADDYVGKPFSPKELLLRVQGVLRRSASHLDGGPGSRLQVGGVTMEVDQHKVAVRGEVIELTATEFKLLRTLMERKGRVQGRDHLLLNVWNYETEIETRTVDTHVRRLREKLGPEASLIETVRGVGYRMIDRNPEACST